MDFHLGVEELRIQQETKTFAQREIAPMVDPFESGKGSPKGLLKSMGRQGLFRLLVPKEYGGQYDRVRSLPLCVAREELARCYNYAGNNLATQGLGSMPIVLAGNEAQKSHYLPKLATGEYLGSMALTEPGFGSDAASITTRAERSGSGYVVNGKKRFASNVGFCDVYVVLAKTDPNQKAKGISAFLVDGKTEGLAFKRIPIVSFDVVGEMIFTRMELPAQCLLGEENQGFRIAMQTLDVYRATVGAHGVGTAQAALDQALTYAMNRVQFNKPLVEHQAIKFKLAEMAVEISAARLLVYQAALAHDEGDPDITIKTSMAKLYATEMAQKVVDQALQIHGGNGLVIKEYPMERLYREVRSPRVYEGTTEIQKLIIGNRLIKGFRGEH